MPTALATIMFSGAVGRSYNVGANEEKTNLEIVYQVCQVLDEMVPSSTGKPYSSLILYVTDRPGHDQRYAIDATRIRDELGWQPTESFFLGINKTVKWYLNNQNWVEEVQIDNAVAGERLGISSLRAKDGEEKLTCVV